MASSLPERFDLGDILVRRYAPTDASALVLAARESYAHLHEWMTWATPEGITAAAFARFIAATTAEAESGRDAVFGIFAQSASGRTGDGESDGTGPVSDMPGTAAVLGGCGLHDRLGPGAIEIGYWLHIDATGCGLMTRVAGALTEAILARPDIARVEIHCDEANVRSAAIPRCLGYTLDRVEHNDGPEAPAGTGRHQIWVRRRSA